MTHEKNWNLKHANWPQIPLMLLLAHLKSNSSGYKPKCWSLYASSLPCIMSWAPHNNMGGRQNIAKVHVQLHLLYTILTTAHVLFIPNSVRYINCIRHAHTYYFICRTFQLTKQLCEEYLTPTGPLIIFHFWFRHIIRILINIACVHRFDGDGGQGRNGKHENDIPSQNSVFFFLTNFSVKNHQYLLNFHLALGATIRSLFPLNSSGKQWWRLCYGATFTKYHYTVCSCMRFWMYLLVIRPH